MYVSVVKGIHFFLNKKSCNQNNFQTKNKQIQTGKMEREGDRRLAF